MPRNRLVERPTRLHILLEKKTVVKLRKLARSRAQSLTQVVRDLAESCAEGRVSLRHQEPLSEIVRRINAMRQRSASVSDKSQSLIRSLRDSRA